MVLIANFIGLKRRDQAALLLAQRWSQIMAVLVAVGAVSGSVLSFEMGFCDSVHGRGHRGAAADNDW